MSVRKGSGVLTVRQLTAKDDRSGFRSGDEALDRFFRLYAGQNQFRHHLGVTYVAVEADRIIGFMTVAPGELAGEPPSGRRAHSLPILRLARLAVDEGARGRDIGERLLYECLRLAIDLSASVGCGGVMVDAKADAVSFYERYGFVRFEALEGVSHRRVAPTPMFLAIRLMEAATGQKSPRRRKS